jgi:hypothetical protein
MEPAFEPWAGRIGVDEAYVSLAVLEVVREHVDERVANLARCGEVASVMAVAPDPPALAGEEAVHTEGDADREAAHSVRELGVVIGLDDDVKVVCLDRVVDDAKAVAAGAPGVVHRSQEDAVKTLAAEARKPLRAT